MASLDTNILLRWLVKDVPAQCESAEKLLASGETFDVADMAIQEVVFVLETWYRFERKEVAESVELLMALGNINCNRQLFIKSLLQYIKHPATSFVDCCLTAYAELGNTTPLYTFDQKLAKQLPHAKLLV